VVYSNTSAAAVTLQQIVIAIRPPGGTNDGGPYDDLAPVVANQTLAPGASLTVTATRSFTGSDPLGAWYAYATAQDSDGVWHDAATIATRSVHSAVRATPFTRWVTAPSRSRTWQTCR